MPLHAGLLTASSRMVGHHSHHARPAAQHHHGQHTVMMGATAAPGMGMVGMTGMGMTGMGMTGMMPMY